VRKRVGVKTKGFDREEIGRWIGGAPKSQTGLGGQEAPWRARRGGKFAKWPYRRRAFNQGNRSGVHPTFLRFRERREEVGGTVLTRSPESVPGTFKDSWVEKREGNG